MRTVHDSDKRTPVGIGKSKTGIRRFTYVPNPHATGREGVLDNFMTGLRQTRLDAQPDIAAILARPGFHLDKFEYVRSVSRESDYYLLTFVDWTGEPCLYGSVSVPGWFMAAALPNQEFARNLGDEDVRRAAQANGFGLVKKLERVEAFGEGLEDTSEFLPWWVAETDNGRFWIDHRQKAFTEDDSGEVTVHATKTTVRLRRISG